MITAKKLIKMATKWQNMAALRRKRITLPRGSHAANCNISSTVEKGHFVVYTTDHRRFVIPLVHLGSKIFKVLLILAEEEYGLPCDGPITLPCDAEFMEYAMSFIKRNAAKDLENALLMSITPSRCLSASDIQLEQRNQQSLVCSF